MHYPQGSAEYGLRMAALLHGPDGSGRATAAAAAAAALGIHLVAYSCLELKVRAAHPSHAPHSQERARLLTEIRRPQILPAQLCCSNGTAQT